MTHRSPAVRARGGSGRERAESCEGDGGRDGELLFEVVELEVRRDQDHRAGDDPRVVSEEEAADRCDADDEVKEDGGEIARASCKQRRADLVAVSLRGPRALRIGVRGHHALRMGAASARSSQELIDIGEFPRRFPPCHVGREARSRSPPAATRGDTQNRFSSCNSSHSFSPGIILI